MRAPRAAAALAALLCILSFVREAPLRVLPALFPEPAPYLRALTMARPAGVRPEEARRATGLIVPHHFLALQLIADAFAGAADRAPRRVLLLCPDHFRLGDAPVTVVAADFATPFGLLRSDRAWIRELARLPGVRASDRLYREHGFGTLTPFIRRVWPRARVCAVALRTDAGRAVLDGLVERLKELLDEDTFVLQSTDFSHYLPRAEAEAMDAQSLDAMLLGAPGAALGLRQPGHIDSVAALYVQARLQQERFHAVPRLLARGNAEDLAGRTLARTTSYAVVRYEPSGRDPRGPLCLGGDLKPCATLGPDALQALAPHLRSAGAVLGNLEGPVMATPGPVGPLTFAFTPEVAGRLARAGFTHLGQANNHGLDQGPAGLEETCARLRAAGVIPLGHPDPGARLQVERLELAGGTVLLALLNATEAYFPLGAVRERLRALRALNPGAFLVLSVHWGHEHQPLSHERQRYLAHAFVEAGADLVAGHHPHVVQEVERYRGRLVAYSLGNLLFDQWGRAETRDGLLLDLRLDPWGAWCDLLPVEGGRGRPRLADPAQRAAFLETLARRSVPALRAEILAGRVRLQR